jgi:HlyD family secretion protein
MNKTSKYIITAVIVFIVLFLAYTVYIISRPRPIEIQGQVEATQIKVASKLVGRIDSLVVYKGQNVKKGELLFTIESPELQAKLQQANAVQSAAVAQKNKANNGARNEDIEAAFNNWKKAEAAANYAKKTYTRINNLYIEGVVPEQKKDEIETKMEAAITTEKAAQSIYNKALKGAREEDIETAGALVKQAQGVVNEVSSYISETHIKSPIDGEVANIIGEQGELIPAGYPIINIVDLDDVWITFNLKEELLADISKGSLIPATIPALGNQQIELIVTYIHVLGDYATWNATKTSGGFDMKTFEVHARPTEKVVGLRPGMSALVDWHRVKDKAL